MLSLENIQKICIESCVSTLGMLGISVSPGAKESFAGDCLQIQIQLQGDLAGYVILEIDEECACKIANTMTQGMMQINCIDDMCKSILGELCNMISGNFSTRLSELGYASDIKPPYVSIQHPIRQDSGISLCQDSCKLLNSYFIARPA